MQTEQGKQIKLKSSSQIKFNDVPNDRDKNINMITDINKSQILPFHRNVIKDTSKNISMSIEKINLDTSYKKVSNSNSKINLKMVEITIFKDSDVINMINVSDIKIMPKFLF